MYRTYQLTGNEKYTTAFWDGDCYVYTVYDTREERDQDAERMARIDREYKEAKRRLMEVWNA